MVYTMQPKTNIGDRPDPFRSQRRHLPRCSGGDPFVAMGAAVTLLSWLVFGLWTSLVGLVIGVVLLDFAMPSALVSNQHIAFALRPAARARLNIILMGAMFLGGAFGSATGTMAWQAGGWPAVVSLGFTFGAVATALQIFRAVHDRRRSRAIDKT